MKRALIVIALGSAACLRAPAPVPVIEPSVVEPASAEPKSVERHRVPAGDLDPHDPKSLDPTTEATTRAVATYTVHVGNAWFAKRAEWLGMAPHEAERRDGAISELRPPDGFWDRQTATEAAALWGGLCNDCHGGRRRVSSAKDIPAPARDWAEKRAFFFGRARRPFEEFRTISGGGPPRDDKPSEMPAWGKRLSREQIWALVYFIAWESGGVEGAFPPGLFPRRSDDTASDDPPQPR